MQTVVALNEPIYFFYLPLKCSDVCLFHYNLFFVLVSLSRASVIGLVDNKACSQHTAQHFLPMDKLKMQLCQE